MIFLVCQEKNWFAKYIYSLLVKVFIMAKIISNIDEDPKKANEFAKSSQNQEEFANRSDQYSDRENDISYRTFDRRFERLKFALGAKNETELGIALGIKQEAVAPNRKKGHIPPRWYLNAADHGISVDWLLYGKGPMRWEDHCESAYSQPDKDDILYAAVEEFEIWANKNNRQYDPDKKARIIVMLYKCGLEKGTDGGEDKARQEIKNFLANAMLIV